MQICEMNYTMLSIFYQQNFLEQRFCANMTAKKGIRQFGNG